MKREPMNEWGAAHAPAARERVRAFAEQVFYRCDGGVDVVAPGHDVDWNDAPARFRTYPGAPRVALPGPAQLQRRFQARRAAAPGRVPTLDDLSLLLYLTLGPLRRKLDITWNAEVPHIAFEAHDFGRGAASGGGLYPTQLYLVAGDGMAPGAAVYSYCGADHALVPVRHGRFADGLARASGGAPAYPYYLLLAPDFWMNCYKYDNFGIHVCSQDSGAMLAAIQLACDALGIEQRMFTAFDDAAVNAIAGADGVRESVFAVVGLGSARLAGAGEPPRCAAPAPMPRQRSRRVAIPPVLSEIHQLTFIDANEAQVLAAGGDAGNWRPPAPVGQVETAVRTALPDVLRARRSAWGSLHAPVAMVRAQLLELLAFVWRRVAPRYAPLREAVPVDAFSFVVQVNRVDGLAPGVYRFDADAESLVAIAAEAPPNWQSTYAWVNYNIDEAGCALFVTGDLDAVMERHGARGYRLFNQYVGMAAQLCYTAAAALGIDCGAVLGARAQHVKRSLALAARENVCLAVYLSGAQAKVQLFDYPLVAARANGRAGQ